ncbi:hypothetical protein WICPIJ_005641 [Wickerhamomyces pijperi]|uniref:Uncharacterized protein n=1 Tax=Wickerhamomyces pijperi TaxID=599730 RepID=A0A9P8Q3Q4_WICPI|nr:hypothetical protein WICPIJ_005641 [Wickerhamomyces pijperi]
MCQIRESNSKVYLDITKLVKYFNIPVTGKPAKPNCSFKALISPMVEVGEMTTGLLMNPFSYFLTFLTISAWSSAEELWWMIPIPPNKAMWMAISASVTVSIGEETNGVFKVMFLVNLDSKDTTEDGKSILPGKTKKSL